MDGSSHDDRPADPSDMSRDALIEEVRRLRGETALARHLTNVVDWDEASARRRLAVVEHALALMPVGFALYDPDDRLVFKNNRYQLHDEYGNRDRPGTRFEELVRFGLEIGNYPDAWNDPDAWLAERLKRHAQPHSRIIQRTRDGRSIQIEERRSEAGYTVATYTDVSQLKQAEEAVDRALQRAKRASESKSIFLANMSHELRTPLNAVIGFAQVLLSPDAKATTEAKRTEYLQDILDAARHLSAIITDILDISRVEAGQFQIKRQTVDAIEICEAVRRMFELDTEKAGVSLTVIAESSGAVTLLADPRALQQMIINLVSNSLRHTPPGGRIDMALRSNDQSVSISVVDTGTGIPAEELSEVTKPFHRGTNEPAFESRGLGLGLALTAMLMKLHDGELRLTSTPGAGTTATLEFPR